MPYIKDNRFYNAAPIEDLATTDVAALATAPAAVGDAALRTETQTVLAALEADVALLATKLNAVINALEESGTVAR